MNYESTVKKLPSANMKTICAVHTIHVWCIYLRFVLFMVNIPYMDAKGYVSAISSHCFCCLTQNQTGHFQTRPTVRRRWCAPWSTAFALNPASPCPRKSYGTIQRGAKHSFENPGLGISVLPNMSMIFTYNIA